MREALVVRRDCEVAIVEIDHPPVNALSQMVRSALLSAIERAEADGAVKAIVVSGTAQIFVAGADIHELSEPPRAPQLADVLSRLEASAKPVVAAISGHALGGGLELALACHYRCVSAGALLGMPEVRLGLLPGAGGTQRLPRLIGSAAALDMMLSGEAIDAHRACELGLADLIAEPASIIESGVQYARELLRSGALPRRLRDAPAPALTEESVVRALLDRHSRTLRGVASGARIIECVRAASELPFDAGLALSRKLFEECRISAASRALRHLFFAERTTGRSTQQARAVKRVAVIGAGTMGVGIAIALADAEIETIVVDLDADALARGEGRCEAHYSAQQRRGRCTDAQAAARLARIRFASDLDATRDCDLAIEAVFESLKVKQDVFAALDARMPEHAVLATNTSYLNVDLIAAATRRPGAVLGMHFFSPANVMKLVEVVRGESTLPEVVATGVALARRLRKLPVIVGNGTGFVGNCMLQAYGRESQLLLLEGATPTQVDAALQNFGMAMGPCAVFDMAGLDVGYRARRERSDVPADPRYFRIADRLVEEKRLGQKSGRGHYQYDASGARLPDPDALRLIETESVRLGVARRAITNEEIVERCILALVVAGARLLESGVAGSPADIDVIWVNGYGFPRFLGGPMWYADSLGARHISVAVERLARDHGGRYWDPPQRLRDLTSWYGAPDEDRTNTQ